MRAGVVGERVQLSEQGGATLMRGLREARPERYPRASTCFRTLYLPAFDTVGLMRSRLLEALECTGFDLA